ncbi:hypothetical protein ACFPVX_16840 [Cohnella faecalis]|uniref:Uncharacterized protein n=1 Tax=Cohnella faecalis TaxID=2315694 RepID=A0A398CKW5_9BACL|nr:hypothetical protein [Cohnella faecalis]RIE02812.1 hypothetical protein D3H35_19450 [Cohnella faecalis]
MILIVRMGLNDLGTKRYWIFGLILVCSLAVDLIIDVLQGIGPYYMQLNMILPFKMMGAIETSIVVSVLIAFVRKPLGKLLAAILTAGTNSSGGGTNPVPPQDSDK